MSTKAYLKKVAAARRKSEKRKEQQKPQKPRGLGRTIATAAMLPKVGL